MRNCSGTEVRRHDGDEAIGAERTQNVHGLGELLTVVVQQPMCVEQGQRSVERKIQLPPSLTGKLIQLARILAAVFERGQPGLQGHRPGLNRPS